MKYFPGLSRRRIVVTWLGCAVGFFGTMTVHGQGVPIVKSIDVEYSGPATVAKGRILAQLRTAVGQPYSDEIVEQDIRALYSLGVIRNVRIFAEPQGNGVRVIVAVQTRPVVREIEIDGASRISAKRLRKEIELKINQSASEEALEKARQKMIDRRKPWNFTGRIYRQ
jgi:outer membrane protein insertion porin family